MGNNFNNMFKLVALKQSENRYNMHTITKILTENMYQGFIKRFRKIKITVLRNKNYQVLLIINCENLKVNPHVKTSFKIHIYKYFLHVDLYIFSYKIKFWAIFTVTFYDLFFLG